MVGTADSNLSFISFFIAIFEQTLLSQILVIYTSNPSQKNNWKKFFLSTYLVFSKKVHGNTGIFFIGLRNANIHILVCVAVDYNITFFKTSKTL